VDDLARVDVIARAQDGRRVYEHNRLAHASGTSQDHQRVLDWFGGNIVQNVGAVPKIMLEPFPQQPVTGRPSSGVRTSRSGPPPRITVGEDPPQFVVPHTPDLTDDLTEEPGVIYKKLTRGQGVGRDWLTSDWLAEQPRSY